MIRALWSFRGFIAGGVKRDFQLRYRGSLLGATWTVIAPLTMIGIYFIVFSRIMGARLPNVQTPFAYGIFLCSGIFCWTYFADVLQRLVGVFVSQANLIKKTSFPRSSLPVTTLLTVTVDFGIVFGLFMVLLLVVGGFPGWVLLGALPLLVLQQAIAVGAGVLLGTLNVFFRDVQQFTNIVIQLLFWMTPVVYPANILPEWIRQAAERWNPMFRIISSYHDIVLLGQWPRYEEFWPQALLAVVLLGLAYMVFRRLSGEMVDEL